MTTTKICNCCDGFKYVCKRYEPKPDCRYWHDEFDGKDCVECTNHLICPFCNGTGEVEVKHE